MTKPTKILIIAANPWDSKRIGIDEEYREIKNIWQQSKQRDQFVIKHAPAARDAELRQNLLDFEPHIVHFSGHGTLDGLFFLNHEGKTQIVSTRALSNLFALFSNQIRCVVLNSCYSQQQAASIVEHIDHVVGMKTDIGDQAAIQFSTGFYQALFHGREISFAYQFACNAIDLANIPEQDTPVLLTKQDKESSAETGVTACQHDVLIHAAGCQKLWAETFARQLEKHLAQRFPQGVKLCLQAGSRADFSQAATNLLILSPAYLADYADQLHDLAAAVRQQRVFLAEHQPAERPSVLTGLLSYCFWQVDPTQGLRSLLAADYDYSLHVENLAEDIEKRLNVLLAQQNIKAAQPIFPHQPAAPLVNDAVVFVNVAAEDRPLAQEVQQGLGRNGIASTLPLDHSCHPPPADIRRDLEINLLNCDAVLVIYGASSPLWVKEQLLMCHRWQRRREEPLKVIALHTANAKLPEVHLPNLQIFYCPPETIDEYLGKFIGALQ